MDKEKNVSDSEMLKTFNCGVGFCIIASKKNVNQIKKVFDKNYQPYEIGYISKKPNRINLFNDMKW